MARLRTSCSTGPAKNAADHLHIYQGPRGHLLAVTEDDEAFAPAVRVPARPGVRDRRHYHRRRHPGAYPFRFSHQQAATYRKALPAGDYGVEHEGELVAVVERKAFFDPAGALVNGSLT